jgi:Ni/Co efflux regulator RcnB
MKKIVSVLVAAAFAVAAFAQIDNAAPAAAVKKEASADVAGKASTDGEILRAPTVQDRGGRAGHSRQRNGADRQEARDKEGGCQGTGREGHVLRHEGGEDSRGTEIAQVQRCHSCPARARQEPRPPGQVAPG